MSSNDEFTRKIIRALDEGAKRHPEQEPMFEHVMQAIESRPAARHRFWAMGGLALAAAIAGMGLMPSILSHQPSGQPEPVLNMATLSPQMIEDLEMLSLLGMESDQYGS